MLVGSVVLGEKGKLTIRSVLHTVKLTRTQVLSCIGDLFSGAKEIQQWLNISARLIAKSIPQERIEESLLRYNKAPSTRTRAKEIAKIKKETMTAVVWTTPLGLPIMQPYRATKRRQIITSMQSVYISDLNVPTPGMSC